MHVSAVIRRARVCYRSDRFAYTFGFLVRRVLVMHDDGALGPYGGETMRYAEH